MQFKIKKRKKRNITIRIKKSIIGRKTSKKENERIRREYKKDLVTVEFNRWSILYIKQ